MVSHSLDPHKDEIQKLFYSMNEKVGAIMEVLSNMPKRGKHKYLVLTVTISRPCTIQIYVVKKQDGSDAKHMLICTSKNIKKLDCRDSKMQPTYDLQLITDYKTWNFRATKLESKSTFISAFCRIINSLEPEVFNEIQLANMSSNVDLSSGDLEFSDLPKAGPTDVQDQISADGSRATETYRPLTDREEEDIKCFLDEMSTSVSQMNATEVTELLQKQLADMEGTNIHSIMESEPQVLKLMATLDRAIDQAERLENQMNAYHSFLADVEEAMSTLHDRDQLTQITTDNRTKLLNLLGELVGNLTPDAKYVRALLEVKLEKDSDIAHCTEAAHYLDSLLNSASVPGREHLLAVDELMSELRRLRDSFAAELAKRVNNNIVNYARQLKFVINVGGSSTMDSAEFAGESSSQLSASRHNVSTSAALRSASELYKVQRDELIQLAPLIGGWLQANRKDVCNELKREYIRQIHPFFSNRINDMVSRAQNAISIIIRPPKGARQTDLLSVDSGSMLSVRTTEGSVLNQAANVLDDLFTKMRSLVNAEEQFFSRFFNMDLMKASAPMDRNPNDIQSLGSCMTGLFCDLEPIALGFISSCEQMQPILLLPVLVVVSRHMEAEQKRDLTEQDEGCISYIGSILSRLTMCAKRAFNRFVERFIQGFKESRPSKKSRCGVIRIVRNYVEFAESSMVVFANSSRLADLERAHGELIRALMAQLEHIASQSVKTPREVVQLENYHRLCDILRRLKMAGLEEYLHEAKTRYSRALQEYTKNCMGRPLEKLATFFEGVQTALSAGIRPEVIQYQSALSKHELKKAIQEYPGREVKRGLESLCKKVVKHLSVEGNLFQVVWHSIQTEFFVQYQVFNALINECYPDSGITLEFTVDDLRNYFAEIANHDQLMR